MRKLLFTFSLLFLASSLYALSPYDRQVWKVASPSTRTVNAEEIIQSQIDDLKEQHINQEKMRLTIEHFKK